MKKEIRDRNKETRARIKELETEDQSLVKAVEAVVAQGQALQQKIAQSNTRRIQIAGAVQELRKQLTN